jgi:CelD/BcsL family acetyltransferase involved in cellulose biosynthesis
VVVTAEVHTSFDAIAAAWDALASDVGASPFVRPGWIAAWWDAFGRGELETFTCHDAGALVAVLPLARCQGTYRSPTNSHTPGFGVVAAEPHYARLLADAVVAGRARRLDLACLTTDAQSAPFRRAVDCAGGVHLLDVCARAPFIPTAPGWASYERFLGGKRRRELSRRERRLHELGVMELTVHDGSERLDDLLHEGFSIEASGWKAESRTAISSHADTRCFYTDVARWAAERGWLRLAFLRVDGTPMAFDFALEADGIHYLLKTGYAEDARTLAPGVVLRFRMVRRAFELGLTRYELLGTVDGTRNAWKREWTDQFHDQLRLRAFAPTPAGRVAHVQARAADAVATATRQVRARVPAPTRARLRRRWWRLQGALRRGPPTEVEGPC